MAFEMIIIAFKNNEYLRKIAENRNAVPTPGASRRCFLPPKLFEAEQAERIVLGVTQQTGSLPAINACSGWKPRTTAFDTNAALQQIGGVAMAEKRAHVAGAEPISRLRL